jgi:hypothetical protein
MYERTTPSLASSGMEFVGLKHTDDTHRLNTFTDIKVLYPLEADCLVKYLFNLYILLFTVFNYKCMT